MQDRPHAADMFGKLWCKPKRAIGHGCTEMQMPVLAPPERARGRVIHFGKCLADRQGIGLAHIGQCDAMWQAFEQIGAKMRVQRPDMLADSGRCKMELAGCTRETAMPGCRLECAQQGDMGQSRHG
jgi:hypothetical protein